MKKIPYTTRALYIIKVGVWFSEFQIRCWGFAPWCLEFASSFSVAPIFCFPVEVSGFPSPKPVARILPPRFCLRG